MIDNDSYFKKALSDFAFDAAYGDSIRHLYLKGYSPEAIKKHLDCESLSIEKIKLVIDRFDGALVSEASSDKKNQTVSSSKIPSDRSENIPGRSTNNACRYEYVKEYDSYGRASFIRRKMPD